MPDRDRRLPKEINNDHHSTEVPTIRFRLLETLHPGQRASGICVEWNDVTKCYVDTPLKQSIVDAHDKYPHGQEGHACDTPYGQNFGLVGEVFKAKLSLDGEYEIVGSQGLRRIGKAAEDIEVGQSGPVVIYHSHDSPSCTGSASTVTIPDACLKAGSKVKKDDWVALHYHPEFKKWFTLPLGDTKPASIAFKMTTDRTREKKGGSLAIGYAQATITDAVGPIPDEIGDTVQIVFVDRRWLEAKTLCEGRADFVDGYYIVTECQGLVQGFWFLTLEDRTGGDQDVRVVPTQNVGHANDDLPIQTQVGQQQSQPEVDCGSFDIEWEEDDDFPNGGFWFVSDTSNFNPCCVPAIDLGTQPPPTGPNDLSRTITGPFVPTENCTPPPPTSSLADLKVRYRAGTYPHMLLGAIGYAQLDNDIPNEVDNTTMRYYVSESDQRGKRFAAVLQAKMCGANPSISNNWINLDFYPHGQTPIVKPDVANPRNHKGMPGDIVYFEWNEGTGQFEVYDVVKHDLVVSTGLAVTEDNGCYTWTHKPTTIAAEYCEEGQEVVLMQYRKETVSNVTGLRFVDTQNGSGSGNSCSGKAIIDHTEYVAYVICADPTADTEEAALVKKQVVVALDADGCPIHTTQSLLVPAVCDDAIVVEADCGECPAESGQ